MTNLEEILSRISEAHRTLATALNALRTETSSTPSADYCVQLAQNEAESSLHWVNAAMQRLEIKS